MYSTLTSYLTITIANDGHYILNEYRTSYWEKNNRTIDYLRNDVKTWNKQVSQQQTHITFFMTLTSED